MYQPMRCEAEPRRWQLMHCTLYVRISLSYLINNSKRVYIVLSACNGNIIVCFSSSSLCLVQWWWCCCCCVVWSTNEHSERERERKKEANNNNTTSSTDVAIFFWSFLTLWSCVIAAHTQQHQIHGHSFIWIVMHVCSAAESVAAPQLNK